MLQQAFFPGSSRRALLALMEQVKRCALEGSLNVEVLLRDQFMEHVLDSALRRQPPATLLEVRGEGMRWEREGLPGGTRECSHSLPSMYGLQYGVQGSSQPAPPVSSHDPEFGELKELFERLQEQLTQLTNTVASMQSSFPPARSSRNGPVICCR